jgi:ribosomal protein L40E
MVCPDCGAENKPDAVFCMSCGGPLPDVPFSQLEKKERVSPQPGEAAALPGFLRDSTSRQTGEAPAGTPAAMGVREGPAPEIPQEPPAGAATIEDRLVTSPGGFVFDAAPPAVEVPPPVTPQAPAAAPADFTTPIPAAAVTPPPPPVSEVPPPVTLPPSPDVEVPPPVTPQAPAAAPTEFTAPLPAAAVTPPPPPAAGQSVVEEIGNVAPVLPVLESIPQEPSKPTYYIPPEADYGTVAPRIEPMPPEESSTVVLAAPAPAQSQESTQAMAPVIAAAAATGRERKSVCPECYAPNPEGNMYCQECGSALPLTGARPAAPSRPAAAQPAPQQTSVLPTAAQTGAAVPAAYAASAQPQAGGLRGEKAFGAADVLALLAIGAGAISIALSYVLDSFTWKKGLDIAIFSHQGAYTPGRTDLLGGPGILPYQGVEFFTVGLVVSIGLALALIFLAVRVGRGPMFILSGCLMLMPAAYMLFQAVLPLRQMGIDVDPALGLSGMFFGNSANAGAGYSMWIITGAGALLVLAGFIAPPRGWGRLLTFLLCFGAVLALAFFCAACYNWNLFISQPAAAPQLSGQLPSGWFVSSFFMLS